MIMIVKTPGSQMGSPLVAEEGGEEVGGGRWESGERSEVQARSTLTSTAPKARSRSGQVATLDEVPRISLRVSSKLPSSTSSCCRRSSQRSHGHRHTRERRRHSREHWLPRSHRQRQRRDGEPRDSKRRCDTMFDFAKAGSYHGSTTEGQKQSQKDRGRRLKAC